MKQKTNILLVALIISSLFCSCESDYEALPLEKFTIDMVFSNTDSLGVQARYYLNAVYSIMQNGHNRIGGDYLDAATDDAISSALDETSVDKLARGSYDAVSRITSDMRWGEYYEGIRMANTFISNIDIVPLMNTFNDGIPMNRAWKAEARFLRAYFYFELVKRYGGVPLVGEVPQELEDDLELPRDNFEDCVDFIISELDAIRDSLRTAPIPAAIADGHVITSGAAEALKVRILLYAASPLFNGGNIDDGNPLTGYVDYNASRWQAAADAAREFMDENTYYSLNSSFTNVFIVEGKKEVIFFRNEGVWTGIETANGPVGFTLNNVARGRTSPSQNLVDCFPMLDGKAISDGSSAYTYDPLNPYNNRDPRMNYTVLHNGSQWLNTILETYQGGKSNPNGAIQKTKTSYYMRKFMGNFETEESYSGVEHNWVMFRYAEILLNFAEAENEFVGPTEEVYQAIADLRARVGIEPGTNNLYGLSTGMTKEEMREIIHNERRIEMAFEEQRYWDIRRWKIAEDVMNTPIKGLIIVKSGASMIPTEVTVLEPSFTERMYLYPIPYSEVINNANMVQNPGWE